MKEIIDYLESKIPEDKWEIYENWLSDPCFDLCEAFGAEPGSELETLVNVLQKALMLQIDEKSTCHLRQIAKILTSYAS